MYFVALLLFCLQVYAQQAPSPLEVNETFSTRFDTLQFGKEGTKFPLNQGTTVPGLWSNQAEYIASGGATNEGALYSFGSSGSTDRSIGTICSNSEKKVIFGFSLILSVNIINFNISILAQQWRYGGYNATSTLSFDYSVSTIQEYQNGTWGANGNSAGWLSVPDLSFTSIVTGGVPVGPVENKTQELRASINSNIPAGNILQLRWTAHLARDGLGIDNLQMDFTPASTPPPVPTPSPTPSPTSPPTPTGTPIPIPSPVPTPPTNSPTPSPSPSPTPSPTQPLKKGYKHIWGITAIIGGSVAAFGIVGGIILYKRRNRSENSDSTAPLIESEEGNYRPPTIYSIYGKIQQKLKEGLKIPEEEIQEMKPYPVQSDTFVPEYLTSPSSTQLPHPQNHSLPHLHNHPSHNDPPHNHTHNHPHNHNFRCKDCEEPL